MNLDKAAKLASEAARRGSQLLCLPEMWTCGFDFARNRAMAGRFGQDIARVGRIAADARIWINGSMPLAEHDGRISNASLLFAPDGRQAGLYRKVHLFSLFGEHEHVMPGSELVDVDAPWGRTGLAVCYDLRFCELFRSYALRGVRVQLCPAAWPHPRVQHWRTLLRARAIENQFFMIAANQVGTERFADKTATYCGHSAIIDPWGNTIAEAGESEMLLTATIDLGAVERVRQKMNLLADRQPEVYRL